jgi:hypothetical protein
MTQLTYETLRSNVTTYSERANDPVFASQLDTFISVAENRLAAAVKQQGFQVVVTGALPEEESFEKPTFWRNTISFNVVSPSGNRSSLLLRSYEFLRNCFPNPTPGVPKYYADYNATNFIVGPVSLPGYTFELLYYARLEPLSEANQENWLTLNAPQVLLAATMYQAALFTKNDARIALWKTEYAETSAELVAENARRIGDRSGRVTSG